jgi:hypothetical protein
MTDPWTDGFLLGLQREITEETRSTNGQGTPALPQMPQMALRDSPYQHPDTAPGSPTDYGIDYDTVMQQYCNIILH